MVTRATALRNFDKPSFSHNAVLAVIVTTAHSLYRSAVLFTVRRCSIRPAAHKHELMAAQKKPVAAEQRDDYCISRKSLVATLIDMER